MTESSEGRTLGFVVSAPRSGSTWLKAALSQHPEVFCTENRLFGRFCEIWPNSSGPPSPRMTMDAFTGAFIGREDFSALGYGSVADYEEAMGETLRDALFAWYRRRSGKGVLVDKVTPYLGTAPVVVGEIEAHFPAARCVFLRRDPRDVLTSGVFQWLQRETVDSPRRRRMIEGRRDVALDRFFRDDEIERWARYWIESLAAVRASRMSWLEISYEAMIANQADVLGKILRHFGVACDPTVIDACVAHSTFEKMSGGRRRGEAQAHAHVRKGVVGDWRNWMTRRDGEMLAEQLGSRLIELGYETSDAWVDALPVALSSGGDDGTADTFGSGTPATEADIGGGATATLAAQLWRLVAEARSRPVWIWGAGRGGRAVAGELERRGARIAGFLTSAPTPDGVVRVSVVSWSQAATAGVERGEAFVAVVSSFWGEIVPNLRDAGWEPGRDFDVLDIAALLQMLPMDRKEAQATRLN